MISGFNRLVWAAISTSRRAPYATNDRKREFSNQVVVIARPHVEGEIAICNASGQAPVARRIMIV
jgi:hypothetical protein